MNTARRVKPLRIGGKDISPDEAAVLAGKMKKKALIPVFILCFVTYMGMGYLSSRGDNSAAANWLEQGVNTLGMLLLLGGTLGLHKAGLREYKL